MQDQDPEILATISASLPRRWIAVLSMYVLAFLLIYVGFSQPAAFGWKVFLIVMGGGSMWLGEAMRKATTRVIELTREGLRDTTGLTLATLDQVQSVDRGFFAFKPSNGFLLRTKAPTGPRCWFPGMWWRLGRTIGVGGVTPGAQTKFFTEMLSALIAERDGKI